MAKLKKRISPLDLDQTMDVNMNGMNYIAAGQGMMLGRDWYSDRGLPQLFHQTSLSNRSRRQLRS